MTSAQELAKALADERAAKGEPSYRMIVRGLYPILGDRTPTDETIRAYHAGKVKHVDLGIATALATYYDTTLADLCPALADEARELVLVLVGGGGSEEVGRPGLEPGTAGLKDPRSTVELATRSADGSKGREPAGYVPIAA